MNATEIRVLFENLDRSDNALEYRMKEVNSQLYVGRAYNGEYCLLIHYSDNTRLPSGRQTKGLSLQFFGPGNFSVNGQQSMLPWAVVTCRDGSLNYVFCALVEGAVYRSSGGKLNTPHELLEYIQDWQELLATQNTFSFLQYIGLWGELFVLLQMGDVQKAISIWAGPEGKKFDFSGPGIDVEVKTSLRSHYHSFSEDQLRPSPSGGIRFILSLHVIEDPAGGFSLEDLIQQLRMKLNKTVEFEKKLLMAGYFEHSSPFPKLSIDKVKAVLSSDVPSIGTKDLGVYNIRFESDLNFCPDQNISEVYRRLLDIE